MLNGEDFLSQFVNRAAAGRDEGCSPDKFVLSSHYLQKDGIPKIVFSMLGVPLATGTYTVVNIGISEDRCAHNVVTGSFVTLIQDGCAPGDRYRPVEAENNFVTVEAYNRTTEEISGTFQMTLAIDLDEYLPKKVVDAPDTIRLAQGRFKVSLLQ